MCTVEKGCICLEHSVLAKSMILLRDWVDQDEIFSCIYTMCPNSERCRDCMYLALKTRVAEFGALL